MKIKTINVNVSYWEKKEFLDGKDVIIIGSGIVGLFTAYFLKKMKPRLRILVLERGFLPHGASTKNAGFACFGSPSELHDDLKNLEESRVWDTVYWRYKGLKLLRKTLSDSQIGFDPCGGYECFRSKREFEKMMDFSTILNKKIKEILDIKNTYSNASGYIKKFGLRSYKGMILNRYEGSIQTGKMMHALLKLCREKGIEILNGLNVKELEDHGTHVIVKTEQYQFRTNYVVVCTNGFAAKLTNRNDIKPARAQVVITEKIKNLNINGTFHYDRGYYYFRNLDGRVLLGGGRNLDIQNETTTEFALTVKIQRSLERMLREDILPGKEYRIEHRWAGIMGVGPEKKPIIEWHSDNILLAVRMGGMGVAIGSMVGKKAASSLLGKN